MKTIKVDEKNWKWIMKTRIEKGFKTVNEVITWLRRKK